MLISTIHNGVIHHDIVHTEKISNRDTPYVIFNIKTKKYQPHYNFIYNKKILIRIAIQHSFSLRQHITRKSKILINHVISAIPSGVIYHNIVHTEEISNHDALYVIFNIKKDKYQSR